MEVAFAYYFGAALALSAVITLGWLAVRCLWWCLRASVVVGIRWARRASSPIE
jgi:hypothetical protein